MPPRRVSSSSKRPSICAFSAPSNGRTARRTAESPGRTIRYPPRGDQPDGGDSSGDRPESTAGRGGRLGPLHRGDETVASAGQGLDEARGVGVVVEDRADLGDADVEGAVEVDGGLAPDLAAQTVAIHHLARVACEQRQDLERLRGKADQRPAAAQLARALVQLEGPEAQHPFTSIGAGGGFERKSGDLHRSGSRSIDATSAIRNK